MLHDCLRDHHNSWCMLVQLCLGLPAERCWKPLLCRHLAKLVPFSGSVDQSCMLVARSAGWLLEHGNHEQCLSLNCKFIPAEPAMVNHLKTISHSAGLLVPLTPTHPTVLLAPCNRSFVRSLPAVSRAHHGFVCMALNYPCYITDSDVLDSSKGNCSTISVTSIVQRELHQY